LLTTTSSLNNPYPHDYSYFCPSSSTETYLLKANPYHLDFISRTLVVEATSIEQDLELYNPEEGPERSSTNNGSGQDHKGKETQFVSGYKRDG